MHPVLQVHETFANIQVGVAPVLPRCHLTAMFLELEGFEGDFQDPAKDMQINFLFLHKLDFIHPFDSDVLIMINLYQFISIHLYAFLFT